MSAILSADDLNDFITPGVACIKPVETLPSNQPPKDTNPYEVTIEDKTSTSNLPAAQISLTDCLACSGCVTSAEAVLVSLQSHAEVMHALNSSPSLSMNLAGGAISCGEQDEEEGHPAGKIFVASVSPQTRASLAATYGVSETEAENMISQLLSGPQGIRTGTTHGADFLWVIDTNVAREACWVLAADEMMHSLTISAADGTAAIDDGQTAETVTITKPVRPVLTSACPGWVCYAEKTHPHVLRHLSRVKSPQALLGTLLKTTLSQKLGISPDRIWHLAIMPCFDKKLEASRSELTDAAWKARPGLSSTPSTAADSNDTSVPVRDVDCVITTKELLLLADSTGVTFGTLPRTPPPSRLTLFPDPLLRLFLFPHPCTRRRHQQSPTAGTSGGYLQHILHTYLADHPGSRLVTRRGRNADVMEHLIVRGGGDGDGGDDPVVLLKTARYYGFRNIQNLVRKLKPASSRFLLAGAARTTGGGGGQEETNNAGMVAAAPAAIKDEYAYVEVMACPGGCTNGGGQIKAAEATSIINPTSTNTYSATAVEQKAWLAKVDEAYFSSSSSSSLPPSTLPVEPLPFGATNFIRCILYHWSRLTRIPLDQLVYTSFRQVQSDVGKEPQRKRTRMTDDADHHRSLVGGVAGRLDGGW